MLFREFSFWIRKIYQLQQSRVDQQIFIDCKIQAVIETYNTFLATLLQNNSGNIFHSIHNPALIILKRYHRFRVIKQRILHMSISISLPKSHILSSNFTFLLAIPARITLSLVCWSILKITFVLLSVRINSPVFRNVK